MFFHTIDTGKIRKIVWNVCNIDKQKKINIHAYIATKQFVVHHFVN